MISWKVYTVIVFRQYILMKTLSLSLALICTSEHYAHDRIYSTVETSTYHKPLKFLRLNLVNPYICADVDLHYEPDLFNCIFLHFVFRVYPIFFLYFGFLLLLANQLSAHPCGARDACAEWGNKIIRTLLWCCPQRWKANSSVSHYF